MIKNRKGFSLITAILTILFIGSLSAYVLNLSGKMTEETISEFKKEQSILYAKSYTEAAIMVATANNCVNSITGVDGDYTTKVFFTYVGSDINTVAGCGGVNSIGGIVKHNNSKGNTIILDTYVVYKDKISKNKRDMTYYRRTVQKL